MIILHCTHRSIWEKALESGKFGFDAIQKNGSIPCIKIENLNEKNFSFPSITDMVILCIDTSKVEGEIKEENDYTNIYGLINTETIISAINYTADENDKFIMNNELRDIFILADVLEKLNIPYESHKYFKDGSFSRTILLNGKYVVKQNKPELIKSEVLFAELTKSPNLLTVEYADAEYRYIVYNYVPGEVMHIVDDFEDFLSNIKEIIKSYADYTGEEWGTVCEPSTSWIEFLKNEAQYASLILGDSIDFLPQVYSAISVLENYTFDKKLLHGDFGTHNFIKVDGKFSAAIDPFPIAGDPLYDFMFALVSNATLLPRIPLDYVYTLTDEPKEKVKAMHTVVLYLRLSACLRHHKQDFDAYIDYWYSTNN